MVAKPRSYKYLIGLGSNIGDRLRYLQSALELLERHAGKVLACSEIYESGAFGGVATAPFLNMAAICQSHLAPSDELTMLQRIEGQLGRIRAQRWGDRTLDLDILAIQDENGHSLEINSKHLQVPHVHLHERDFALLPAADVAPDWPVFGAATHADKGPYTNEFSSPACTTLSQMLQARNFRLPALQHTT